MEQLEQIKKRVKKSKNKVKSAEKKVITSLEGFTCEITGCIQELDLEHTKELISNKVKKYEAA